MTKLLKLSKHENKYHVNAIMTMRMCKWLRFLSKNCSKDDHMSAEQKWCFLNRPKGETNIFQLRTPHCFRGYVSSNQIHFLFGTLGPKMGQKGIKMGLKCLGLVWDGLAWSGCDIGSWQHPRIFSIGPK